jgi:hypothetical protein
MDGGPFWINSKPIWNAGLIFEKGYFQVFKK